MAAREGRPVVAEYQDENESAHQGSGGEVSRLMQGDGLISWHDEVPKVEGGY
jgi:hypothetical protein